jgi:hypothetical protein
MIEYGIVYFPCGMVVTQDGNRTEMKVDIRFQNIDDKDDYILVPACGYGIDNQDKGPGKAISYATKMALLKIFSLETGEGEDPDFDQTTTHKKGAKLEKSTKDKMEISEEVERIARTLQQQETVESLTVLWNEYMALKPLDNGTKPEYDSMVQLFKDKKIALGDKK